MTNNAAAAIPYRAVTRHEHERRTHANCRGINHADSGEIVTHDRCGADVVRRDDGNLYNIELSGFYAARKFSCWRGTHDCDPKLVEAVAYERAVALASGEVAVKNANVTVVKGRKVPVGITGVVFWVGDDGYGKSRIGLRAEDGTTYFVLAEHCRAVNVPAAPPARVAEAPATKTGVELAREVCEELEDRLGVAYESGTPEEVAQLEAAVDRAYAMIRSLIAAKNA